MALETSQEALVLPLTVVGRTDVSRLLREIAVVDDFLSQSALRQGGSKVSMPRTSHLLEELFGANKLNALQESDRLKLQEFLETVKQTAPVITISFSVDPPAHFIGKLMQWLRREIHPRILLQTGLQPNIGAGCVVRTTNKYFDFSLREQFTKKRDLLISKLREDVV